MNTTPMPFHDRMAELWAIQERRDLTYAETYEMTRCLKANMEWVWKVNCLHNLSYLASVTYDNEWQYDICARLDALELSVRGKSRTKKKPGRKGTD